MKRAIVPQRLLAVAVVAGVGCSAASSAKDQELPPVPKKEGPSMIEALREELLPLTPSAAREREDRFRPLCDADGYPLVGNAIQKTIGGPGYQPSAFCADVRSRIPNRS